MALPKEEIKTIADIEALPEGTRAELIDGRLFSGYGTNSNSSSHCQFFSNGDQHLYSL